MAKMDLGLPSGFSTSTSSLPSLTIPGPQPGRTVAGQGADFFIFAGASPEEVKIRGSATSRHVPKMAAESIKKSPSAATSSISAAMFRTSEWKTPGGRGIPGRPRRKTVPPEKECTSQPESRTFCGHARKRRFRLPDKRGIMVSISR